MKKKENVVDEILEQKSNSFVLNPANREKCMFLEQVQRMANKELYGAEELDFSTLTIKEKTPHGWMRVMAISAETVINGRWDYWLDIRATQEVEGKPIPQLNFKHGSEAECKVVSDMIKDCLNYLTYKVSGYKSLELFIDWLLYGWGCSSVMTLPPEVTDSINEYWYRNFKAQYMFAVPCDYFVRVASELYGNGKFNVANFYPTPSHVVQLMVAMTYNEDEAEKNKYAAVCEPCMGSGIILLYQSNHSLRLYGQDIDQLMCKIATVNGYFYMPWLVEGDAATSKLLKDMHEKYNDNIVDVEWSDNDFDELCHIHCKEADLELLEVI